jgi:DNA-binding NarL/FixJ family response regulator
VKSILIIEDDLDIQSLIETIFSMDSRFCVAGKADSAELAIELARKTRPQIIVLDDRLSGSMRGVDAVSDIKKVAPEAKIILFSAHADLQAKIDGELTVDGFLLKTRSGELEIAEQQAKELDRLAELERFQRLTIGRELRMIELKKENESLRKFGPGAGGDLGDLG